MPISDTARVHSARIEFLRDIGSSRVLAANAGRGLTGNLQDQGIYLKQYGYTGLSTFSLRGADPQQTQVLWNGLSVSGAMTGMADLNTLGLSGNEELVVFQGGTSSFFGSGNVGGTLLLNTPVGRETSIGHFSSVSSYGNQKEIFSAGLKARKFSFNNTSYYSGGKNNFQYNGFENGKSVIIKMDQAASERYMQRNTTAYSGKYWFARAVTEFTSNRRGPGETLTGPAGGTLWDRSSRIFAESVYKKNRNALSFRTAWFRDFLRYRDENADTDDTSRANTKFLQGEWVLKIKNISTLAGFDLQSVNAVSEAYLNKINRLYPASIGALRFEKNNYQLNLNGRFEWYEKIPVYSISVLKTKAKWKFRVLVGTSFRRPALNDLFWQRPGNFSLTSEKGRLGEIGLIREQKLLRKGKLRMEFTFWMRELDHPIIWVYNGSNWQAVNLYSGKYRGIQGNVKAEFPVISKITTGFVINADVQNSAMMWQPGEQVFQRIFIPNQNLSVNYFWKSGAWQMNIDACYTGSRYTSTDNTSQLPGYFLLNSNVSYAAAFINKHCESHFYLAVLNITNASYQVIPGRPMPLRGFELGVKLNYKK